MLKIVDRGLFVSFMGVWVLAFAALILEWKSIILDVCLAASIIGVLIFSLASFVLAGCRK